MFLLLNSKVCVFDLEQKQDLLQRLYVINQALRAKDSLEENKPKGLKVAKEDQWSIGLMVDMLDGR